MAFRKPDHDSVRVTAVMHSLDEAPVPSPNVDAVEIDGNEARVRLSGSNGLHAVVRLRKDGVRWVVQDVIPVADPPPLETPALGRPASDEPLQDPSAARERPDRRVA